MDTMKKASLLLHLLLSLVWFTGSCNQSATTDERMSVDERMANARAAKAERKTSRATEKADPNAVLPEKATPDDYKAPVDKVLKGPNGEAVHVGERGAKFYINKNGNKTYLSSNR